MSVNIFVCFKLSCFWRGVGNFSSLPLQAIILLLPWLLPWPFVSLLPIGENPFCKDPSLVCICAPCKFVFDACEFVVNACKCTFACDQTPTYQLQLEIAYKFVINACKFVVVAYECILACDQMFVYKLPPKIDAITTTPKLHGRTSSQQFFFVTQHFVTTNTSSQLNDKVVMMLLLTSLF